MNNESDKEQLQEQLAELSQQHQVLDQEIENLHKQVYSNQLHLTRLKKQKLALKERIEKVKSSLIPDRLA
jgi:hypothetical protein